MEPEMIDLNCLIEFVAWNVIVFVSLIMASVIVFLFVDAIVDWLRSK